MGSCKRSGSASCSRGKGSLHSVLPFCISRPHSLLYQTRQRSFLFDLTKLGVVDGMRLGNKVSAKPCSRFSLHPSMG